jgi:hypothetical protein
MDRSSTAFDPGIFESLGIGDTNERKWMKNCPKS